MILNNDSRARIKVTVTTSIDPTDATLELKIDDTWYPCDWDGDATEGGEKWTRVAHTTGYFAGPAAVADGAVVLSDDPYRHFAETRVSWPGGDTIVNTAGTVDVKE